MTLPFRGFAPHRPYPATGLSTARWAAEVDVEPVPACQLWLTQRCVQIAALFGVLDRDSDSHPHVVAHDGELYLEDGHHRVVREVLMYGYHVIHARVFRPDQSLKG